MHEYWCGHIELALCTVIQISGETEHGWKSQKKIQNILSPPPPKKNWNYFEINFMTARCCSHIPRRRRGKGKVDRLIPEVASASASAITAEQKAGSLCIFPFHFPYFPFNRQGRYQWTVSEEADEEIFCCCCTTCCWVWDWGMEWFTLCSWLHRLAHWRGLFFISPWGFFCLIWDCLLSCSHSLSFPLVSLFLFALAYILKDKEIWFY